MSGNNSNLIKTLKTINKVIGNPSPKSNQNNSTKKSKRYSQSIETRYYENNKSQNNIKENKKLEKKQKLFQMFQKKLSFRKWLYRLRLEQEKLKHGQIRSREMTGIQKHLYDYQFVCYSDHFRIPPKHAVDRMRRILPNFEFNHIEEVRRDKYDIKLLWPVNNILFPPKEKDNRVHKIPTPGRNEYLEQINSVKRLSKPKPDHTIENNIYNNYYRHKKISQREALNLCQRLNFKPTQKNNYDYLNDYYNLYDIENERKKRKSSTSHKKHSYSHDNYRVEVEQDQHLSNLTQEIAQNGKIQHSSSNSNHEINTSNNSNINDNNKININTSHTSSKSNHIDQVQIEQTNNIQHSTISSNINNNKSNSHSFGSNTEENTEIVSDSYLLDISANQIRKKKNSNLLIIEEEEEDISNELNSKSKDKPNNVSRTELNEEEEIHNISSIYNSRNEIKSSSNTNILNIISDDDEEEEIYKKISNNKYNSDDQIQSNSILNKTNEINITSSLNTNDLSHQNIKNEEEEIYNDKITYNNQSKSSSHQSIGIEEEEEVNSDDEIHNNYNIHKVTTKSYHTIRTAKNEEEEVNSDDKVHNNLNIHKGTTKSYRTIRTAKNDEEEANSDDEIHNDYNIHKVTTKSYRTISTSKNEEEEDNIISSQNNIVKKTSSKVIHTSYANKTINNQGSPEITHVVKQFTHSTSKQYDDELFSDSSVDNGILIGNTSSGLGPDLKNSSLNQDDNIHQSDSSDSFI